MDQFPQGWMQVQRVGRDGEKTPLLYLSVSYFFRDKSLSSFFVLVVLKYSKVSPKIGNVFKLKETIFLRRNKH
jgi:hypothetical protein